MASQRLKVMRTVTGCAQGVLFLLMLCATAAAGTPSADVIAKGRYVFAASGGCGCHTETGKAATGLNAGGRRFDAPFGTVYSTNITPDRATGIGNWTDDQIIAGIRLGRRPNGERIIPIHPFMTFNGMADEDLRALVAYLRSVPPIHRPNQPKKITVPLFERKTRFDVAFFHPAMLQLHPDVL